MSSPNSTQNTTIINVEHWLKNARLLDCHSIFIREQIEIEELLGCTDIELLTIAEETLHLNALNKKRFIQAIHSTKMQYNCNELQSSSPNGYNNNNTKNKNTRQVKIIRKSLNLSAKEKDNINKIQNGIKILNDTRNNIESQIDEYFDVLQIELSLKKMQILETLNEINIAKSNALHLRMKQIKQNDYEYNEMDSLIQIDFNTQQKAAFINNICLIKTCTVPDPPIIKLKSTNFDSMTLRIVTMTTNQKKRIIHYPFRNDSKNNRVTDIEVEYIQTKYLHPMGQNPFISQTEENIQSIERFEIDENAKLQRIFEMTLDGLLPEYYCYVRARIKNKNGWSAYKPLHHLKFDRFAGCIDSIDLRYTMDDRCVVFEKGFDTHRIAVMDKRWLNRYDIFQWKFIVEFEENDANVESGICMGFISLDMLSTARNCMLGTQDGQYGLFVSNNKHLCHIYYNVDGLDTTHNRIKRLDKKVSNGDEFIFICDMKNGKCNIYHNQQRLMDVFHLNTLPKTIVPAVSGYTTNGMISCHVSFIPLMYWAWTYEHKMAFKSILESHYNLQNINDDITKLIESYLNIRFYLSKLD